MSLVGRSEKTAPIQPKRLSNDKSLGKSGKESQSHIRVAIRVRPCKPGVQSSVTIKDNHTVEVYDGRYGHERLEFKFDKCYGDSVSQEKLFDEMIQDELNRTFECKNTTIFAYGVTGAGKTYTMQGFATDPGIIPRSVQHIFRVASKGSEGSMPSLNPMLYPDRKGYSLSFSMMEIYLERVFDLLDPKSRDLSVLTTSGDKVIVKDLSEFSVKSYSEFNDLYQKGALARKCEGTTLNKFSSRSHLIAMLNIKWNGSDGMTRSGKLTFIDLAGCEDNRKTDNTGKRMTESGSINTSLFVLGKVITALNNGDSRIPYRDSKLTRLLQDSLGGNSIGIMICNISPEVSFAQETISTLSAASKSRKVINIVKANPSESQPSQDIRLKLDLWKQSKKVKEARTLPATQTTKPSSKIATQASRGLLSYSPKQDHTDHDAEMTSDDEWNPEKEDQDDDDDFFMVSTKSRHGKRRIENTPIKTVRKKRKLDTDMPLIEAGSGKSLESVFVAEDSRDSPAKSAAKTKKTKKEPVSPQILAQLVDLSPPAGILAGSWDLYLVKIVSVLNEGTLKQLKELSSIGRKRAKMILEGHLTGNYQSVRDLTKIGFKPQLIQDFLKANYFSFVQSFSMEDG